MTLGTVADWVVARSGDFQRIRDGEGLGVVSAATAIPHRFACSVSSVLSDRSTSRLPMMGRSRAGTARLGVVGDPGGIRTRDLDLERVASWARLDDGVSRVSIPGPSPATIRRRQGAMETWVLIWTGCSTRYLELSATQTCTGPVGDSTTSMPLRSTPMMRPVTVA